MARMKSVRDLRAAQTERRDDRADLAQRGGEIEHAEGFCTNAVPERDYEGLRQDQLPSVTRGDWVRDRAGMPERYVETTTYPSLSEITKQQVFCSTGERVGTMTFGSAVKPIADGPAATPEPAEYADNMKYAIERNNKIATGGNVKLGRY